jgi:acyl transferase domain-containing protein
VLGKRTASLRIGAVKAIVGDLDAVVGVAGLIKTVLALAVPHSQIRAAVGHTVLNPVIPGRGPASSLGVRRPARATRFAR